MMKTTIQYLWVATMLLIFPIYASGKENPVKTKITHVTVFLKGAQITREGTVALTESSQTLVFHSLSSDIRPGSIQVEGRGNFTIMSVKYRTNYLDKNEESPELQGLRKELDALNHSKELLSIQMEVLKGQESMLQKNQTVSGQNGLNITTLTNAMNFYEKKMKDIKTRQMEVDRKSNDLAKKIKQVTLQIDELTRREKMSTGEVVVTVRDVKPGTASFVLSYYTSQAGWRPEYDVRVDDITKDVKINYKAFIKQTTGETWDKIPVTLSTGNPAFGGNKPDLNPWYLDFKPATLYKYGNMKKGMQVKAEMAAPSTRTAAAYTSVIQKQTTTEFEIMLPYMIPSENREQAVTIKEVTLPAVYAYCVVPKLDRDAFLMASVTGWKKYDFLSGKINLFLEGSFTGTSWLDVSAAQDTLQLTLGKDKRIKVERKKIRDFTQKQMLGNNVKEIHGWKIIVMNTKKVPVHLIVEEQIPLSKRKEIVVEPLELSGARLDKLTGKCLWYVDLQPEKQQSFVLRFSVKYPKNKTVYID